MRLVLASGNTGKLRELQTLLAPLNIELISQAELQIAGAPETACTFVENALLKARHAAAESGLPALADDSGLVVPALGGEPGIHSARYAADAQGNGSDAANNAKLLQALHNNDQRSAYFYCALVLLRSATDPAPLIATGRWDGSIGHAPQGAGGFGYDPLFQVRQADGSLISAAALPAAEKNQRSHRGQAVALLLRLLAEHRLN